MLGLTGQGKGYRLGVGIEKWVHVDVHVVVSARVHVLLSHIGRIRHRRVRLLLNVTKVSELLHKGVRVHSSGI